MVIETLQDVLESAADAHQAHCGLVAYPPGSVDNWSKLRYGDLRTLAQSNASSIRLLKGFVEGSVILLHFVSNLDSIVWFWSVLYAGCVPAMSTPFSHNPRQRQNHLNHLHTLLKDPLCITTVGLLKEFEGQHQLKLQVVDNIPCLHGPVLTETITLPSCQPDDLALLMLTSGSTGNAKAVALKHRQIIASVSGKAAVRDLQPNSAFLNWVGLDHVASIVETHLQAMYLCMDQVHVQAADIIANPRHFLTLIERHDVSRSFAPNFFLAMLRQTLESDAPAGSRTTWNLTALRFLGSGGEANPVDTCDALSGILSTLGAPKDVIVPGKRFIQDSPHIHQPD